MSWMSNTRSACNGNTNGYIYALVRMNKRQMPDGSADLLTRSDDPKFYLTMNLLNTLDALITQYQGYKATDTKKVRRLVW